MSRILVFLLLCGIALAQQSGRYRPCSATETTQCVPTIDASGMPPKEVFSPIPSQLQ